MGILRDAAALVERLDLPAGCSVCELGDQWMSGLKTPELAADWYRRVLGCGRYVSIDGNARGTLTWDLNLPIRPLPDPFDLVTDFGTGEHIFDQAQVFRTIHELTKPGGFLVIDRPTQGYGEHCFYTITRGLLEDLAAANRYVVRHLETVATPRGALARAVFQTPTRQQPFRTPQQGRYRSSLQVGR